MSLLHIAKFGGTSVADVEAMNRCAAIVAQRPALRVIVVSAPAGITNALVTLTESHRSEADKAQALDCIQTRIQHFIEQLNHPPLTQRLQDLLAHLQHQLTLTEGVQDPRLADDILACGEQISSHVFAEILRRRQIAAQYFDVRDVMLTDARFGRAEPILPAIRTYAEAKLKPLCTEQVLVTQGFIGRDQDGNTTTLGRGGSDYTAALLAEALDAQLLEVWTDVLGIFSTDPRLCPKAQAITDMSFDEAAELATFGAKVLHPATLIPAMRNNIPVFVGSSQDPSRPGTTISRTPNSPPRLRALALRKQQTLLTIHSVKMLHSPGFLAKVFSLLAKHKISVDLVTTSEVSVALTLDQANAGSMHDELLPADVLKELERLGHISIETDLSLIGLIGNGLHQTPGISAKLFSALAPFNVRLICHGASSHNVCFLVEATKDAEIMRHLHQLFFESTPGGSA